MNQGSGTFSRFLGYFRSNTSELKSKLSQTSLSTKTTLQRRETLDISHFDGYLSGIPFDIRRIKNKRQPKSVTLNSVKMELLQKCYRNIPAIYFLDEEKLDFGLFFRSRKKTEQSQQKINDYLDQLQVCLFNQVTSRFDQFVAVLRTIQSLDLFVNDNLSKIKKIRSINKNAQNNLLRKAEIILHLQQKKRNREEVLQKLLIFKRAQTAKQQVQNLIVIDRDKCLNLISQLKLNRARIQALRYVSNYDLLIEQSQQIIKRDFTQSFSEQLFKYITMNATYDRKFWEILAQRKDLLAQIEDLTSSTVLFDDQLEPQHRRLSGIELSPQIQDKIVQIIMGGWSNNQLSLAASKSILDQHFIQQFENLLSDIRDFSSQRLVEAGEQNFDRFNMQSLLEHMSIQFYSRVLEYYSSILKRYLRRLFSFSKKCLSQLLKVSVDIKTSEIPRLNSIMQNLFNIQLFVVKSSLQKFVKLINLKKIGANVDFFRFKAYLSVLEAWESYFNNEVSMLYSQITVPEQSPIKQRFYVLKNKLNSRYVSDSKDQLIQSFFNNIHRYVLNIELKKSLEEDDWQVVDIPTEFYEPIGLLLSGESYSPKKKNHNNTLQNSLFVDKQISYRNRSIIKGLGNEEITLNFKLIKSECIINGKMYKFTQTFLLFIEQLEEYTRMYDSFPSISQQISSALVKLCEFYNSYTFKLIVEAGAVHFQKLKTKNITTRHLAVSSLCLEFLLLLLEALSKRIKMHAYNEAVQKITSHHQQIVKKLRAILQMKISKSLPDVVMGTVPSLGTLSIINSTKALFQILSQFYSGSQYLKRIFDKEMFSKYIAHLANLSIKTLEKAQTLKQEVSFFFGELQFLSKIVPEYNQLLIQANNIVMKTFQSL